jgi:hypothetical protein
MENAPEAREIRIYFLPSVHNFLPSCPLLLVLRPDMTRVNCFDTCLDFLDDGHAADVILARPLIAKQTIHFHDFSIVSVRLREPDFSNEKQACMMME